MDSLEDKSQSVQVGAAEESSVSDLELSEFQPESEGATHLLLSVTQDLNTASDLQSGLRRVAERLKESINYDTLGILLLDDLGRELRFELAIGFESQVAKHWRFGMGQGIATLIERV